MTGKTGTLGTYMVGPTTPEAFVDAKARGRRPDPFEDLLDPDPVTDAERARVARELEKELALE